MISLRLVTVGVQCQSSLLLLVLTCVRFDSPEQIRGKNFHTLFVSRTPVPKNEVNKWIGWKVHWQRSKWINLLDARFPPRWWTDYWRECRGRFRGRKSSMQEVHSLIYFIQPTSLSPHLLSLSLFFRNPLNQNVTRCKKTKQNRKSTVKHLIRWRERTFEG